MDAVWGSLQSNFLTLPKGPGFISYDRFATAYDTLRSATAGFTNWSLDTAWRAFTADPLVFVVVRTILGMTPPEWAYLTSRFTADEVSQGQARSIDRLVRESGKRLSPANVRVIRAMLEVAVNLLSQPVPPTPDSVIHRLDKVDSQEGLRSLQYASGALGIPYPVLLYERFLGRPFASHRDAVSEIVGEVMEGAVEDALLTSGVAYRKTKRAERVPGFEQAPDFIIPDETRPRVVIEAKITEDDGTARDKVTRILYLATLAEQRAARGERPFQVVACIDGRGFGIRREDMRRMILATRGKVFTLRTLGDLVDYTDASSFRTKRLARE